MRDPTLHSIIESFTAEAAGRLTAETERGAEIPFELVQAGAQQRGRPALYCYRPLTAEFIGERLGLLSGLPSYVPALRSLADREGTAGYLEARGAPRIPGDPRARADAALSSFLSRVFAERSEFGLDPARFTLAYEELEQALYAGQCVTTVIAPVLGLALESTEQIALEDGLALVPGEALADAPAEAVWLDGELPNVLALLRITGERSAGAPIASARIRFRRIVTALRLFERGTFALGPMAWTRTDDGPWRPLAIGGTGRHGLATSIPVEQEDELRAFSNLIARRVPTSGELAWALARYEMGCERVAPLEALTDYLLALRALIEPEGPESGRLAGRLAAICAPPEERASLTEAVAETIGLERAVIMGLAAPERKVAAPVTELAEHLRAILRDVLCGHLDSDLCRLADGLLAEGAQAYA
ncbi:MAG: hypothetical protein M3018_09320 [Actinomycetota bacterium]|nr:hypothetical protein [Actinomycetota bacterium]